MKLIIKKLGEIVFEQKLDSGEYILEVENDLDQATTLKKKRLDHLLWPGVVSLGALMLTLFAIFKDPSPKSPDVILNFAKPKLVEFRHRVSQATVLELKKYANLVDSDLKRDTGFCTGFLVEKNVVLTSFHCLRGSSFAEISTDFDVVSDEGKNLPIQEVLGFDLKRDYVFLRVENAAHLGQLEFAPKYRVGEKVYSVGNVEGLGLAIRDGIMASTTPDTNDPSIEYLRYSAPASPGNSGGPLLNAQGKVVGIVFARSMAENYNVGTAAKYLLEGEKQFVKNTTQKSVTVALEGYQGTSDLEILTALHFPMFEAWINYPEDVQPFKKLAFTTTVPQTLEQFSRQFLDKISKTTQTTFAQVVKKMKSEGHAEGGWENAQALEFNSIYLPDYFDSTQYHQHNKELIPQILRLLAPPSHTTFKKYVDSIAKKESVSYASVRYNAEINDRLFYKDPKKITYNIFKNEKLLISNLSYQKDFSVSVYDAQASVDRYAPKALLAEILGEEGALFETYHLPFVRPKSHKQFTVKSLDLPHTHQTQTDAFGRVWDVFEWPFLTYTLQRQCQKIPVGHFCLTAWVPSQNKQVLKTMLQNDLDLELSHLMLHVPFWNTDRLMEFKEKKGVLSPLDQDGVMEKTPSGKLKLKLKTLGATLEFAFPQQLRLIGSMKNTNSDLQSPTFFVTGFDGVYVRGETLEACTFAAIDKKNPKHPGFDDLEGEPKETEKSDFKKPTLRPKALIWKTPEGGVFHFYFYCTPLKTDKPTNEVIWKTDTKTKFDVKLSHNS